jgi:ATP-dependent exoDNAse (exonuclease V) alpha subunit
VVILVLHKGEAEFADKSRYLSEELLYVGFTRARHLLYVVTVLP